MGENSFELEAILDINTDDAEKDLKDLQRAADNFVLNADWANNAKREINTLKDMCSTIFKDINASVAGEQFVAKFISAIQAKLPQELSDSVGNALYSIFRDTRSFDVPKTFDDFVSKLPQLAIDATNAASALNEFNRAISGRKATESLGKEIQEATTAYDALYQKLKETGDVFSKSEVENLVMGMRGLKTQIDDVTAVYNKYHNALSVDASATKELDNASTDLFNTMSEMKDLNKSFDRRANLDKEVSDIRNYNKELEKQAQLEADVAKQQTLKGTQFSSARTKELNSYLDKLKQAADANDRLVQSEQKVNEESKKSATKQKASVINTAKLAAGAYALVRAFKSFEQAVKKAFTLIVNGTKTAIKAFATITASVTKMAVTLSGLPVVFKGIFSAISGIANSIKSTVSGISFTNLLKESSDLASSLHETQNRVEQVFGAEGANLINKFSETAISSLGMATLTARDFAASFGAALRSTGQSVDNIQQMSIGLTKLSADLASFYDIEQDIAKEKLFSGVISGQVKAMRQLGVDMTVASLKAYTLQEGYSKLYTEMTAAEKQAVRYRYAMDKLNYVHGDYQRTITSTANQLRLLKNQFKELGTIIGSIINKFFQPLLIWLNAIASKVLEVAKTIASVMGIDWTLGAGSGSAALPEVTDEYDDMAESAEAVADAEGNATDNLHKLSKAAKNALAPFHKLNVLQNKTAKDAEKSSGGVDIGVITPGETSGVFDMKKALGDFFDWLWSLDWEGAVKKFADAVNDFFKGLPEKVQDFFDKLQPWIQRIVECFNLLISEIDWHVIGSTISEVIEGIGRSIGTAADTLNAANLGKAFADLVNGLIDNKDMFTEWGHAVGSSIDNAFEFVANAAKEIHWSTLGTNLFEGLKEGLKQLTPANIHDAIYNSLSGISTTITTFFESLNNDEKTKTKIGECIHAAITGAGVYIMNGGWHDLLQSISTFITNALKGLKEELDDPENQKAVATAITELIEAVKPVAAELKDIAKSIYENYLKPAVEQFLKDPEIPLTVKLLVGWEIVEKTGLGDLLKSIIQTAFAGAMIKGAIKKGLAGVGKEVAAGAGSGGGAAEVSLLTKALGALKGVFAALAPYIASVLALLAEFFLGEAGVQKLLGYDIEGSTFAEKWKSFWGNFAEITTNAWNNTKTLFTDIIPGVFEGLGVVVGTTLGKLIVVVSSWFNDVKAWFVDGFNNLASSVGEFFAPVGEAFKTAFNFLTGVALTVWEDIKAVFAGAAEWFSTTVWQPIVDLASPIIQNIATFFNELWISIQSVWSSVSEWFVNLWNTISTTAQEILAGIGIFFNELWVSIQTVWGEVTEWFQTTIWQPITDAVMQLKEDISTFFTELWEGIKETWGSVVEWFQTTVWQPLTDAADTIKKTIEESFGDAVDYVQEKWQGFVDFFEGIYNTVKDWLTDLIDMAKEWANSMVAKGESFWSGGSSSNSVRGYADGGVFLPNKPQLALLGDNKSQTEYALTTGHLQQIASMMAGAIGSGNGGVGDITIPIYLGDELLDTRMITAGQMHSYRSNGR